MTELGEEAILNSNEIAAVRMIEEKEGKENNEEVSFR